MSLEKMQLSICCLLSMISIKLAFKAHVHRKVHLGSFLCLHILLLYMPYPQPLRLIDNGLVNSTLLLATF